MPQVKFNLELPPEIGDLYTRVKAIAPTKVRARVSNAMIHYDMARKLDGIDDAMGLIRVIAAEEELVVAIFELIKLNPKLIDGARRITNKHKNHVVKSILPVVLEHMATEFLPMIFEGLKENFGVTENTPKLGSSEGKFYLVFPSVPGYCASVTFDQIKISVLNDDDQEEDAHPSLLDGLKKGIMDKHGTDLKAYFLARSGFRNTLLYAHDGGFFVPARSIQDYIDDEYGRTILILMRAIAILATGQATEADRGMVRTGISLYEAVLDECGIK